AQETGLILPIGYKVIQQACIALATLIRETGLSLFMSLNIEGAQIEEPQFLEQVERYLAQSGLKPQNIKLEILESVAYELNIEAWVQECRQRGFQVALDDFGTGSSSLQYMNKCNFDTIKIDQSFVREFNQEGSGNSNSICQAIVSLAAALKMTTVAEGIEYEHQRADLRAMGCTYGQGYVFSKPLPLEAAIAFCQDHPMAIASQTASYG
ncbi:MAG: EAL domain-containing protein, partial [Cyanobacteria bacterium P01_H01_bin.121]